MLSQLPRVTSDSAGRYDRQQQIPGWSQERLRQASILVVGAGALGNEVLKNLALLGVGTIGIVDFDVVELSNLSRCVLFRSEDAGKFKAVTAARRLLQLNPEVRAHGMVADITREIGAGVVAGYDLVLGALDSIEARLRLNRLCLAAGVPWIDAGIDAFCGQVSHFRSQDGPCYECGMTASMWRRMHERRSCLAANAPLPEAPLPTSAVLASLTAALQIQEALAFLYGGNLSPGAVSRWRPLEPGRKISVRVLPYEMDILECKRREDCMAHSDALPGITIEGKPETLTAQDLFVQSGAQALRLEWDLAIRLDCSRCGGEEYAIPLWRLTLERLGCPRCGEQRLPELSARVEQGSAAARLPLTELGVPHQAYLYLIQEDRTEVRCELIPPHASGPREGFYGNNLNYDFNV